MELSPEQKKLKRLAQAIDKGSIGLLEVINEVEEELEEKIEEAIPQDDKLKELIEPLIPAPEKGDKGDKGDQGDKGDPAPEVDLEAIASLVIMDLDIPEKVIERVTEKTEVVHETPIVTENVVEVAKYETPDKIRDKLETLEKDERLDKKAIKGLDNMIDQPILDRAISILDQRTSFLINKVSGLKETIDSFPTENITKILVVDAGGNGDYTTITEALTASSSGYLVYITPGTYAESNLTIPNGVDVEGAGVDVSKVITSDATNAIFKTTSNNQIFNLTIQNTHVDGAAIDNTTSNSDNVKTIGNRLAGGADVVLFGANSTNQFVIGNEFFGTYWDVINATSSSSGHIHNNIVNVTPTNASEASFVVAGAASNICVENNIVVMTRVADEGALSFIRCGNGSVLSKNNRVVLDAGGVDSFGFSSPSASGSFTTENDSFTLTGATTAHARGVGAASANVTAIGGTVYSTSGTATITPDQQSDVKTGEIIGVGATSGELTLAFPATITDYTLTLPSATANGFIKNTGGTLSFATVDVSADTNLAVSSPITLTGDTVGFDFSTTNTWTGSNTFNLAVKIQADAAQIIFDSDSAITTTLQDSAASSSKTITLPNTTTTLAGLATAQTFTANQTIGSLASLLFASDNASDIGSSSRRVKDIYIAGNISDGTVSTAVNNLARLNTANTFTANQTISGTAPLLTFTDTTASADDWSIGASTNDAFTIRNETAARNDLQFDGAGAATFGGAVTCTSINTGNGAIELAAGTYTPTRSAEANMDANVTMFEAQYMRVGATVTVSGRFTADPTLAATVTSFEMTLPVASNIGAVEDCAGTAFCGAVAGMGAQISGVVANDTMKVAWISSDITSQSWSFTATYQVI